jgi:hypothetical protein
MTNFPDPDELEIWKAEEKGWDFQYVPVPVTLGGRPMFTRKGTGIWASQDEPGVWIAADWGLNGAGYRWMSPRRYYTLDEALEAETKED